MSGSRKVRTGILPAAAITLVGLLALPGIASAASHIRITAYMGSRCIFGTAPVNDSLHVVWKDASGSIKGLADVLANGDWTPGGWQYCADAGSVAKGDRIKITDGAITNKLAVPELSLIPDRSRNTYHGRGPAGETVFVGCPFRPIGVSTCGEPGGGWAATVGNRGNWSFDTRRSLIDDVRGGDYAEVYFYTQSGYDQVVARTPVPYVVVTIGYAGFRGIGVSGQLATVTLYDGVTSAVKAKGGVRAARDGGGFKGEFHDASGRPVKPALGDRVVSNIATDASFVLEGVQATADATGNHVYGTCPGGSKNVVLRERYHSYPPGWADRGTSAVDPDDGSFELDLDGGFVPTSRYAVGCQLATGDFVQAWVTTPTYQSVWHSGVQLPSAHESV